ncbi:RDD family protein [Streptomyces sp. B1I3]|uniref:RDD family protein n=1 Tax=Streptomyces sp. B1I3 TaxID=3042264 RepID=UPI00277EF28A|nr:RDD family protein [Streptomyces sp. B1I3]MDQ0796124.1 putative RDD family membrane protein YckC [Streptomyces sp. B1I3]
MSAPTPAPGDESPREGYYPDPSIPGYVRYWNGASWVPGTSRPAPPDDGTSAAPQQGGTAAASTADAAPQQSARRPAPVDETGPMFLDEVEGPGGFGGGGEVAPTGNRPEPASAWQADTARQGGFGGEHDRRVSWGGPDPRTAGGAPSPAARPGATPPGAAPAPTGDAAAGRPPADPRGAGSADPTRGALPGMRDGGEAVPDGTVAGRADRTGGTGDRSRPPSDGTLTIRAVGADGVRTPRARETGPAPADGTMTMRAVPPAATPRAPVPAPAPSPGPPRAQTPAPAPHTPLTPGPGGGSASWAQQVHQLAQPEQSARPQPPQQQHPVPAPQQGARPEQQPVIPWKPPVDDPFQQLARSQASARPAGLGRRLAARFLDTVVLGALVGAVGFPLVTRATDHIDGKIEAAKQSGETVTVWLLDSTTAGLFGAVLGAFLVLGFMLEALPTAKWGRTLGKKLCGIEVRDIESHDAPSLGAALRRWLVYGVLGLLVIGVVNVLWCLVDRPWRQCWHDKAARTFVAG